MARCINDFMPRDVAGHTTPAVTASRYSCAARGFVIVATSLEIRFEFSKAKGSDSCTDAYRRQVPASSDHMVLVVRHCQSRAANVAAARRVSGAAGPKPSIPSNI